MLTLSTHDTKRSADVRARISVLAELPEAWEQAVDALGGAQRAAQRGTAGRTATPSTSCTRRWSGPGRSTPSGPAYMDKATREAKVHTSWTDPDADYDEAVRRSSRRVLADQDFVADLETFLAAHRIVERGPDQLAGPADAAPDLPGRPRPLPGHRAVGPVPGRPRQPPPGRLRRPRAAARTRWPAPGRRTPWRRGGRGRRQAVADPPPARPPAAPSRGLRPGVGLRAARASPGATAEPRGRLRAAGGAGRGRPRLVARSGLERRRLGRHDGRAAAPAAGRTFSTRRRGRTAAQVSRGGLCCGRFPGRRAGTAEA